MKLFMLLLGGRPRERNIEQHDIFFGIAEHVRDLVPHIKDFWKGSFNIHLDAWREVNAVDTYRICVKERSEIADQGTSKLFFLNLGGYKPNEFEEFHYKMLTVAADEPSAIRAAKHTAFFKHTGFDKATSHVDNKYAVDADDIWEVKEILPAVFKDKYFLEIQPAETTKADEVHLGFFRLHEL